MNHPSPSISEQIEQLVREHIAATRRAAAEALERAFSTTPASSAVAVSHMPSRKNRRRRTPAELAALGERLYEVVCGTPGETMAALAPEVGVSAGELHRPVMALKREGRVHSIGQRHHTRYYPGVVRGGQSGQ